ncbi:MAG: 2-ketoisovalerate ferredoxin oxidoreductase [Elusimicrobia bacterium GWC2_65_9]|nr:MAG: 2-ketoisovalerate ferredoxin oxidoreductase [Elusimicrobia bacterium GWC2_65_9]
MKTSIAVDELMTSGHQACQGCGATLTMRYALKGLGPETVVVLPACCWTIIAGAAPRCSIGVPLLHAPFAAAAAAASGVKAGLSARGDGRTTVMAWAGDGGTYDIGIQALSGAADRNEDIIYCCYDNEAYMNTGIQRSGGTPSGAWTMTTPGKEGSERPKKDLDAIMEAHRIPYIATATPAYPEDMVRKFAKAKTIKGFRFIHVLSPCPPGWKYDTADTVKLSRLAVQTGMFALYEIAEGRFKLNLNPAKRKPVGEYLKPQGRFRGLKPDAEAAIQAEVDARWALLSQRHARGT